MRTGGSRHLLVVPALHVFALLSTLVSGLEIDYERLSQSVEQTNVGTTLSSSGASSSFNVPIGNSAMEKLAGISKDSPVDQEVQEEGESVRARGLQARSELGIILKLEDTSTFSDKGFVMAHGDLQPMWAPECALPETEDCVPYTLDAYTDQMTLDFVYSNPDLYSFKTPTLQAKGGRAQPLLDDFSNDADEKGGEITLRHDCAASENGTWTTSLISMTFQIHHNATIELSWLKVCGAGPAKHVDYGFITASSSKVSLLSDTAPTAMPSTLSSRVYISLLAPSSGRSQHFSTPTLEPRTSGHLTTTLRGSSSASTLGAETPATFDVLYTCLSAGRTALTLTIAIPPWTPLTVSWIKDCGGGPALSLNVTTNGDPSAPPTALQHGQRLNATALTHASTTFYLRTTAAAPLVLGAPSATSQTPLTATASLKHTRPTSLPPHGAPLTTLATLTVSVTCIADGRAEVTLAVPVQDRAPAEWSAFKDCAAPTRARRRRLTAGAATHAGLVLFAVATAVVLQHAASTAADGNKASRAPRSVACGRTSIV